MQVMTISDLKSMETLQKNIPATGSDLLLCSACLEILFEPITLPCGNVVCCRCLRRKEHHYCCPIKRCPKRHYYRNESVNVLIQNLLYQIYPIEQQSLLKVKEAEQRLHPFFYPRKQCEQEWFMDEKPDDKDTVIMEVIETLLTPAIELTPYLQLPLIVRAKALAEIGRFESAIEDARAAHFNNKNNQRGVVAEKLILWRQEMHQRNMDGLATCAISALCSDRTETVHSRVQNVASQLREDLRNIQVLDTDRLPYSSSQLQPVLNHLKLQEMECNICLSTMNDPVTCPCGHSWCRSCILDSMNQSDSCPLCRVPLPSASYFILRPVDAGLDSILKKVFQCDTQDKSYTLSTFRKIPIFVCSLVFPGSKAGFHMFEPRYRAMIKKCMDTNQEFGIVMPDQNGSCKDYGTVVRITHCEPIRNEDMVTTNEGLLPRYIIETHGLYRFKILEMSVAESGYSEAVVEPIYDEDPEDIPHDPSQLDRLVEQAQSFVSKVLLRVPPTARLHFERKHGKVPSDPSRFSFWIAEFLPMNPHTLYHLLPLSNVMERMELICGWVNEACRASV